ncbi:radical SAM protein, partial [bacterium]
MLPDNRSFLLFFADYAKRSGFKRTLKSLARQIKPENLLDDYLAIKGICDGRKAFKGPLAVQIDLTDNCNNDCLCCWCNSPLVRKADPVKIPGYLDPALVLRTIDELKEMGVREITLSGGGEPFTYPHLFDIVKHIKDRRIRCQLYTNFTLVTEGSIDDLVDLKLDLLVVSLWAGNPKTYHLLHPNKKEGCFDEIRNRLIYLSGAKKKKGMPLVRIHNVINALNYNELSQMADFARQVKSDEVSFCVMDSVAVMTDTLLLNDEQRRTVLDNLGRLDKKAPVLYGEEEFIRRVSCEGAVSGNYDEGIAEETPCYSGWLF